MAAKGAARRRAATGTIAGFVLRTARESASSTHAAIAEMMGVDLATWQGWETGRRPLANMKAGTFLNLRRRLLAVGADPQVLHLFDPAMDADRVISATIHPQDTARHPLSGWVHTRDTAHMLAWALDGTPPPLLAHRAPPGRRGPAARAPLLMECTTGSRRAPAFSMCSRMLPSFTMLAALVVLVAKMRKELGRSTLAATRAGCCHVVFFDVATDRVTVREAKRARPRGALDRDVGRLDYVGSASYGRPTGTGHCARSDWGVLVCQAAGLAPMALTSCAAPVFLSGDTARPARACSYVRVPHPEPTTQEESIP
jgi:hypothetical protein